MVFRLLVGSCGSNFSFLCHGWQTFSGVRVAQSLVFCVMVGRLLVGSCGSNFSFLCHGWQTFSGVRVAQSLVFCVMAGRLLVGFVWLNLQFSVSWQVDFQWGSCGSIFSFLCHNWQTFSRVRVAQSLVFCVRVGSLLVGFVWLNLQFSVSWSVNFQWGSCGSIFSFLCHGWQTFSGVRVAQSLCFLCHGWQTFSGVSVAQSLVFCVMVGRLLVGFVWLNLQLYVSWLVDFQWASCGSIFRFLCHGRQTFSGVRVAQSFVFCVMVGRPLVDFVWLNLQIYVSWQVDFQWGSCGSIFSFLCHGWQTFSGFRVAQSLGLCFMVGILLVGFVWLNLLFFVSWLVDFQWVHVAQTLVFCVMVGRLLVGFVWLNLQFSVSWLVDFQWVRVAQTLVFCVMVGRLLVGFVCLNLQFSVSWLVDFQWVRVAQTLVFCVMVGRLLVGFVWLKLQFSVSWLVDFQWGSCGSIFSFLCHGWQTFSGVRVAQSLCFLCHGWQTFSGVRVAQSLVFRVMVGRLLVGFVWLNLQFSVSWLVDFQWGSCGSIFSFLCHGWQTFSGLRVAQSLVVSVMIGRLLVDFVWLNLQISVSWQVYCQWGSCGSIFCFLCHGWQTFSGVRVAQSLVFCVMVGRLLVGFVWLNLQFSVSWLVDFQWGSCGSIFSFLCHGRQTFSGVRVAQSLVFCVMVGRLLVGFVWLNLQFSVSGLVAFQGGSCGSIFSFLCHGRQTFSGVRVAQSLVFCVLVGRLLVGFVWLNLYVFCVMVGRLLVGFVYLNLLFSVSWFVDFQWVRVSQTLVFCVRVGRLLVGFVWLNLQFSVSWLVDFQWGSCGSNFSFLCHGWQTFSGVRVAQSLVFCVMAGRLLVGFVWLNLQFSVSWQVDFQWGSCGSIFSFLCHGWQTFSRVRVAQSLVFCVRVGSLLVGFVWLNLQFSVSWLVNFQWGSCGSIVSFLCHGWQTFSGVRVAQSLCFLCHGWQTFSGVSVAQSLVFCVMVGRFLVGFVWLNLQISVSWQVDFQWGSCGSIFCFLCHGWQTFSVVRVAQSLVFCVMVGRLLVDFVWLNLQIYVSWQVYCQWGSCGSIFSFLCHGWQTFSRVRVAQSLVFCVRVGSLSVGFVWLNLQFSVSWSVNFQWGSCGSIFSFLCHGWQTFSGVRVAQSLCFLCHGWQTFSGVSVAQSLVFCVMVGRLLVGFVWLNLQFYVSWLVDFQWASCGSIFRFLCHGRQTFSGVRVAQSFVFCVMVGRLLVGFVWLNLQFSVSWFVDFQWISCGSIFRFLFHGRYTVSGVRVAQSFVFCVMVGRLLVGFVWLNLQFSVSWQVDFQWGSCGSIFSFLCHGRQTFSGVRVAQSLAFCVMVCKFLVGFVWLNLQFFVSWQVDFSGLRVSQSLCFLCHGWQTFSGFVWLKFQFSVSWLVDFQWGSCGSIFSFLCHGWQTFSGFVWHKLQFSVSWLVDFQWASCVSIFSFLCHGWQTFSGFVWLKLQFSVSWLVDFQWGSCGSNFSFLCHGWQTFSGVRVAQSLVFCVMVGRLLVGFVWLNLYVFCVMVGRLLVGSVWLNLQFSVSWLVDFQWGSCGSIFSFLCHGWQTFSGVRVAQSLVFYVMVGRLLVGFVWLNLQLSVS